MNIKIKAVRNMLRSLSAAASLLLAGCGYIVIDPDMGAASESYESILNLTAPQEEPDLTVSQLLKRMRETIDPKGVWYNCKSYILRQTSVIQEKKAFSTIERYYTTEIKFRQPAQMRQTSFEDGKAFQTLLYRDGKGWVINQRGRAEEYTGEGMKLFKNYIGFSDPRASELTLFSSVDLSVVYEDDYRLYRMICRSADEKIPPYVRYIDAETFLPVRMETVMVKDGERKLYRAEPRDYKWISDVKMPMTTIVHIGDSEMYEYHTTDLVIDPVIPESEFTVGGTDTRIDYMKTKVTE